VPVFLSLANCTCLRSAAVNGGPPGQRRHQAARPIKGRNRLVYDRVVPSWTGQPRTLPEIHCTTEHRRFPSYSDWLLLSSSPIRNYGFGYVYKVINIAQEGAGACNKTNLTRAVHIREPKRKVRKSEGKGKNTRVC